MLLSDSSHPVRQKNARHASSFSLAWLTAGAPIAHVDSFTNLRRRLGPVRLSEKGVNSAMTFGIDTIRLPNGRFHESRQVHLSHARRLRPRPPSWPTSPEPALPWRAATSKTKHFFEALGSAGSELSSSAS